MNRTKKIIVQRRVIAYLMINFSAALYALGLQGFLQVARTFSSGLGALAALPTFIFPTILPYISLIYLALNIPLICFFWNKNRRKFMYRTVYFLIWQTLYGLIFLIPNSHESIASLLKVPNNDIYAAGWPVLMLATIGAILIGTAISIAWKFGGSTGGTDLITYYYSTKKQMDVAFLMFFIAVFFILFSFAFTISFNEQMRKYWLITLFSSLFYMVVVVSIVNFIYPKYKKVRIMIVSDEWTKISQWLKDSKYHHSWQIEDFTSGYLDKPKKRIVSIIFLLESKEIINNILMIDPKAWISLIAIRRVIGNFDASRLEDSF